MRVLAQIASSTAVRAAANAARGPPARRAAVDLPRSAPALSRTSRRGRRHRARGPRRSCAACRRPRRRVRRASSCRPERRIADHRVRLGQSASTVLPSTSDSSASRCWMWSSALQNRVGLEGVAVVEPPLQLADPDGDARQLGRVFVQLDAEHVGRPGGEFDLPVQPERLGLGVDEVFHVLEALEREVEEGRRRRPGRARGRPPAAAGSRPAGPVRRARPCRRASCSFAAWRRSAPWPWPIRPAAGGGSPGRSGVRWYGSV